MKPHVADGWLIVPYTGPELARIEVGVQAAGAEAVWAAAFLDWVAGVRVAKIRTAGLGPRPVNVLVRVNGSETTVARGVR